MVRKNWNREFDYGLFFLNKHKPENALRHLQFALNLCPVSRRRDMNTILYYLGITLKRLGLNGPAVKSWNTGKKLYRNGLSSTMYDRHVNGYGMVKQETSELDDWNAFYSIQLKKYLFTKRSRKLGSEGERDMIWDLIYDHWVVLLQSGLLENRTVCEKWKLFSRQEIVFPFFKIPQDKDNAPIPIDFHSKQRVNPEDPCPCRSGMSYIKCCGRIKSEEEIIFGVF